MINNVNSLHGDSTCSARAEHHSAVLLSHLIRTRTGMLVSFLRNLVCIPSSYADYDPLETIEQAAWPAVSFPPPVGPITRLPSELIHLIIRSTDSTMLATCSLVCANWMVHARARMFCCLSISMSNADRFSRLFSPPARVTFGSNVREIELDDTIVGDFWTSHVLPRFIADFPRLRTLTIFGVVPASLPSAFQVVTHLELNYVSNWRLSNSPDRLASFISAFPRLETLKLAQESGPYVSFRSLSDSICPPPHLRHVDLDNPLLLPWLTSVTPPPPIEAVHFEISRPGALVALESLRCLSPSLRTLELILSEIDIGGKYFHSSDYGMHSSFYPTYRVVPEPKSPRREHAAPYPPPAGRPLPSRSDPPQTPLLHRYLLPGGNLAQLRHPLPR